MENTYSPDLGGVSKPCILFPYLAYVSIVGISLEYMIDVFWA